MTPRADLLTGIGVSSGCAVGPVALVVPPQPLPADERGSTDPAADLALIGDVLESVDRKSVV